MKNKCIKGVILDMDGVIVDSYEHHFEAWRQFSKRHGLNLSDQDIKKDFGRRNRDIFGEVFDRELSEGEIQDLDDEKEAFYRELHRRNIKPAPGLMQFLVNLKGSGIKTAIGSSATLANIEFVMNSLGLSPWIDAFAHSGMVQRGKPEPEIFLKAAELIGISPEGCVVFEDSLPGIQAGLSAGMKVIAVATTRPEKELGIAHGVVKDFQNLGKEGMEEILGYR